MNVTIDKKAFAAALAVVGDPKQRIHSLPVRIDADVKKKHLIVTGTDLESICRLVIPAEVKKGGVVNAVDFLTLLEAVKKFPGKSLVLSSDGKSLVVSAGAAKIRLDIEEPVAEVLDIPATGKVLGTFPAEALAGAISGVRYAASTDTTKYNLCGVYLHTPSRAKGFRAVTTDGHRLAIEERTDCGKLAAPVLMPAATADALVKILATATEPVTVALAKKVGCTSVIVTSGDLVIAFRPIDGQFPEYSRVIPTSAAATFSADSKKLAEPLAAGASISKEKFPGMLVSLDPGKRQAVVSGRFEGVEVEEKVKISGRKLAGVAARFNARFLLDALKRVGEVVTCQMNDYNGPAVFCGGSHTCVIMPMRF